MSVCHSPEVERCLSCGSPEFMISPGNIPLRICKDIACRKGWLPNYCKIEETITIKKALWDEMLEYKSKVDELEEWCASCSVCYPPHPKKIEERIENLEKHKNYQIDENRKEARLIEILEAIETLETQMSRVIAYINEDNDRIEQLEKKLINF